MPGTGSAAHALKLVLLAVTVTLVLLSLLGTVAHASGLVDDTVNADNLYSKYPLSNYQLDFYVDNSWSWLPWNWLDGIGKSVQYGLYCITNFVWTISLYLSNATGYVVQQAYKLDFFNAWLFGPDKICDTVKPVLHRFSNAVQPVPRKPRPAIVHIEIKLIIGKRIL